LNVGAELPAGDPAEVMAAVDLGSNSFHMVVARAHHGQVAIVDRLREMVRLASGLSGRGYLDSESQDRALACLRRFGQRIRDMHAAQVRVVGTNTLRKARNAEAFLSAAEDALGHPVEVISGMEEARLVYLGVSHHIDASSGSKFVVDIGGGSTELIIGEGYRPVELESLSIGCVGMSRKYFDNGRLSRKRFGRARLAASQEFRPVAANFLRRGWDLAIGSSGTVRAAAAVVTELGLEDDGLTLSALEDVIARMIAARRVEDLPLPGLGADRAPVFAGGIAILTEFMQHFGIERLAVSDGALREGLLYDMIGRQQHEDARETSIRGFQSRFHVDRDQADRVEQTAARLLEDMADAWGLRDLRFAQLLRWAARLHEVGLDIAHSKHHLHGAYLLANADLPGFARIEQHLLSALVGNHRRRFEGLTLDSLKQEWRGPIFKLTVLLRLAVVLHRARSPVELPAMGLSGGPNHLEIVFPKHWFGANPLTHADLIEEQEFLEARGFALVLKAGDGNGAAAAEPLT
jgi:exopolyphosphatase/guanosine-5'-triphosphate,3'-diphosphate pyrophosphatase